ncbi:MAG: V-type ATP synthase subunit D [Methylococcales bacterium]|nr:V-type ATP synthase subunit D [Methylococcales bacterium]
MSQLNISKQALHKESARLKLYQKYLPSLDLKRQQLLMERNKADRELQTLRERWQRLRKEVEAQLPMLAEPGFPLEGLCTLETMTTESENIVGITVPKLSRLEIHSTHYSLLARPHWLDHAQVLQAEALRLQVEERIAVTRREMLAVALKKVTQKVNLFEKVLIPKSQASIRKIRIYLGDAERAAVVRAKITKQMREAKVALQS